MFLVIPKPTGHVVKMSFGAQNPNDKIELMVSATIFLTQVCE
jgi:hypothetical protein